LRHRFLRFVLRWFPAGGFAPQLQANIKIVSRRVMSAFSRFAWEHSHRQAGDDKVWSRAQLIKTHTRTKVEGMISCV
jgi:hypothetical protein